MTADDELNRATYPWQQVRDEVGTATAQDHGADGRSQDRRCGKGDRATRTGTIEADGQMGSVGLFLDPAHHEHQPPGELSEILIRAARLGFGTLHRRLQIEQKRAKTGCTQLFGHRTVARAVPATAAAMDKDDETEAARRQFKIAVERIAIEGDGQ